MELFFIKQLNSLLREILFYVFVILLLWFVLFLIELLLKSSQVHADVHKDNASLVLSSDRLKPVRSDSHAPIGVMGDHMHNKGEWMFSYRYMYMDMAGNRNGKNELSPEEIISSTANRFFGIPGQPANLRIVPTKMSMEMHMFGGMYAPSDWLTLMLMTMYTEKSMKHVTFNGAGSERIGTFDTKTKGIGDIKITGLIRLFDNGLHHLHINAGLSLPSGSNQKRDNILAPNGTSVNVRLPYPMQLGSGTLDALPGVSYTGGFNYFSWGAQHIGTFRLGSKNGYSLGDKQNSTAWVSYQWRPWINTSTRLSYSHEGKIDGIDSNIVGPVQTADPDNHGGDILSLHFGFNLAGQSGLMRSHRLTFESDIPLYRNLNGPQMETDVTITLGWQYAF